MFVFSLFKIFVLECDLTFNWLTNKDIEVADFDSSSIKSDGKSDYILNWASKYYSIFVNLYWVL